MKQEKNKRLFALIGKNISYSFSRHYFTEKFKQEQLSNCEYMNFDIQQMEDFLALFKEYKKDLQGMNVTIPYKLSIFNFLDKFDKKVLKIGAVNTIKITKNGKLKGYNTDVYGFKKSLSPLLKKHHTKALILGTGGGAKAVAYVLKKIKIKYKFVSRNPQTKKQIGYHQLSEKMLKDYTVIINCTPLGMHPNTKKYPKIPYQFLTKKHLLYDLIYNPFQTIFLTKGKEKGTVIKNGLEMLKLQAEKSWNIWNS